ncbi:MAG: DUF1361 domain-containing protein [Pseudanabaena sp.]|jgi:uncharacterized membrane protein
MTEAFEQFFDNFRWMGWNLFLAIIPYALSFILFDKRFAKRSPKQLPQNLIWWFGIAIFILFLPNAPYILTDIIHFVYDTRLPDISTNGVIFVLIPQYFTFILLGYQLYVLSMMNLIHYLSLIKLVKNTTWVEIVINFICAIGVYWGRVNRLNSWYVLTQPRRVIQDAVNNLESPNFFLGTFIFFVVFTGLYYIFKWINLAIAFYWNNRFSSLSR